MGSDRARETVRRLQADITSGRWPVNGKIPTEAELAAELGVGRSTVREAVRSLAHLGMLEPAPGRGTFVRSLNPVRSVLTDFAAEHSWEDLLMVRRALEVQAAELAAELADADGVDRLRAAHEADLAASDGSERGRTPGQFHALLVDLSGNRLLSELYSGLMAALRRGIESGALHIGQDEQERHDAHAGLLEAIAAGRVREAGELAGTHACRDIAPGSGAPAR
ncbi:FadR/GntR family transcriptional regulator [Nocardioides humi]|uniref:FadR/GntR family transcriptional regulator n=1 Tax=Nocardioides humi TaxID=449461 RepID=A0ABN2AVJ1_9ACTN|nr:FCD domain-containing protein [Nocardioides humi]